MTHKHKLPCGFADLFIDGFLGLADSDPRISFEIDADRGTVTIVWNGNDE